MPKEKKYRVIAATYIINNKTKLVFVLLNKEENTAEVISKLREHSIFSTRDMIPASNTAVLDFEGGIPAINGDADTLFLLENAYRKLWEANHFEAQKETCPRCKGPMGTETTVTPEGYPCENYMCLVCGQTRPKWIFRNVKVGLASNQFPAGAVKK